jgi:3-isopropylmalate/(R)-2-methylmalate dehydratase large subunit
MVIEAGGKNGVIAPDQKTLDYVRQRNRSGKPFEPVYNDADARFVWERVFDVRRLEPVVAKPHSPDNRAYVSELRGLKLDRAYIGSCTGGKLNDFRAAARILHGRSVRIDTFIVPATTEIEAALRTERLNGQTLAEIFLSAGARLGPASCAACLGGPSDTFGRLNAPLTCISATNRNFPGRMGHKQAQVYLASPLTVAASAVAGCIADPRDYL